jgi:hypothetical protein
MGWPSKLSYKQIAETGIKRSLGVLAFYADLDAAEALLRANPALANDPEALAWAAERGHEAIVRLLLRHEPRLAERIAVVAGTPELTELLFQNGMNPNLKAWLGVTPLHRFAREGNVERAAIFLDYGADPDIIDEEFCTTPLGYAALNGRLRMVEFLLRRGASATLPDAPAWATPKALAVYRNHHDIVRVLETFEITGVLPPYPLESLKSLANDFVVAYETGDADAYLRVIDHFHIRRPMAWDRPDASLRASRLRRFVQARLLTRNQTKSENFDLSDAQLLIARSYGFRNWQELLSQT